jgi:hypothetical protein
MYSSLCTVCLEYSELLEPGPPFSEVFSTRPETGKQISGRVDRQLSQGSGAAIVARHLTQKNLIVGLLCFGGVIPPFITVKPDHG